MEIEKVPAERSPQLKKHIGTVEISNSLSLLQRKAFSLLVWNAYPKFKSGSGQMHEISISALSELLGYDSKDLKHLDESIGQLQKTLISWVGNEKAFHRVTFFSYTGLKGGMYRYRFAPELEEKLYSPEIYARINVLALRQFQSRYTVALYENLSRYRPNKNGFAGGSPRWTIDQFKSLMGVGEIEYYNAFKELNRKIINVAVKEINAVSDLKVSVIKIKDGRSIVRLKFDVDDNPQQSLGLIPEPESVETAAQKPLAQKMNELTGAPVLTAGQWMLQHGENRFEEVLELLEDGIMRGTMESPLSFVVSAFENGWIKGLSSREAKKRLMKAKGGVTKKNAPPPEPEGWQEIAPGNLGERSWQYMLTQYPEEAADLFAQLSNG